MRNILKNVMLDYCLVWVKIIYAIYNYYIEIEIVRCVTLKCAIFYLEFASC